MCISTCGSSLAHKQKPSVVQAIEEQKHYLTATVVLRGAVINMAPTADCGFSAFQNVCVCMLSASAGVTRGPCAFCLPAQNNEDENGNSHSFFF